MFAVHLGELRVDVFVPSIEFSWEAGRTRVAQEIDGRPIWFLSAEALCLVAIQGTRLDAAYVRRHIVEMMGEDDERVRTWDRLVREFGSPP